MDSQRTLVPTKDEDGNVIELAVLVPGNKMVQAAQKVYNVELSKLMREAVGGKDRLLSKKELDSYLEKLGIWTQVDQLEFVKIQIELREMERKLAMGGMKMSEAKDLALHMRLKRLEMLTLYSKKSEYENMTMESQAEYARFKFLMYQCVVKVDTGERWFKSADDYDIRQDEQASVDTAEIMTEHLFGFKRSDEDNLVENKWLKDYGLVDNEGHLVDEQGRKVDGNGRLIDGEGRLIDENGNYIDNEGRIVDENYEFVVEKPEPFIDDKTGEPVLPVSMKAKKKPKKKTAKKRGKKTTKK